MTMTLGKDVYITCDGVKTGPYRLESMEKSGGDGYEIPVRGPGGSVRIHKEPSTEKRLRLNLVEDANTVEVHDETMCSSLTQFEDVLRKQWGEMFQVGQTRTGRWWGAAAPAKYPALFGDRGPV
jgi:hypothetical protein